MKISEYSWRKTSKIKKLSGEGKAMSTKEIMARFKIF